ncbi:MAG: homoserine dehydrogenase [Proteobacteria bacterium]|nr:homoserine dehydrogenase [Pseudomonadota bacterium]
MTKELRIAIAGLGVVGGGVYNILTKQVELLNKRSKNKVKLVAVSSRSKKDFVDESKVKFYENTADLAKADDVDVVVELIGGSEGIAYELCKTALKNKKHFVTANKAMIATHGVELTKLAEENGVCLAFEAGVAGAIPVLKSLREGLIANDITKVYAILNGTCNYILSKMAENGDNFDDVLKDAQKLGYAEADPTFDIEGIDSAHKLAIIAAIAKNAQVDFDALHIEGITKISIDDINLAKEFGYNIKLLGIFKDIDGKTIQQTVYPALIKSTNQIAAVSDSYNAALSHGNNCEWSFLVGRGAGAAPTASAVVADILDVANENYNAPFGVKSSDLIKLSTLSINDRVGKYYIRFNADKDFAKANKFTQKAFSGELIEKSIIKEVSDNQLLYALLTKAVK